MFQWTVLKPVVVLRPKKYFLLFTEIFTAATRNSSIRFRNMGMTVSEIIS
jgi:hypothetical protein